MKTPKTKPPIVAASEGKLKFALVYETYADKIYKYFWYRSGQNAAEAEDLMQETFLRAYKKLSLYEERGVPYFFYLLTIARNLLINFYRKPKAVQIEESFDIVDHKSKNVGQKVDADILWNAVQTLNMNEQKAINMYYREDMPIKQVASHMKKTENAVKLILSRGRKKLMNHPSFRDLDQHLLTN